MKDEEIEKLEKKEQEKQRKEEDEKMKKKREEQSAEEELRKKREEEKHATSQIWKGQPTAEPIKDKDEEFEGKYPD